MTGFVTIMTLNRSSTLTAITAGAGARSCGASTSHMAGFMAVMALNIFVARFFLLRTFTGDVSLLLTVIALNSLSWIDLSFTSGAVLGKMTRFLAIVASHISTTTSSSFAVLFTIRASSSFFSGCFTISCEMTALSAVVAGTSSVISFPIFSGFSSLSGLSGFMKQLLPSVHSLAKWPSLLQLKHLFTLYVIFLSTIKFLY